MASASDFITAFAPASIGNIGVGFDMLGLAISGAGDRVSVRREDGDGVRISAVYGLDGKQHDELTDTTADNTAGVAAAALWAEHGEGGIELVLRKGVPLQSGMGSSAASAVAGAVAANALLEKPLPQAQLMPYALAGEKVASGSVHADNVAPSLLGGMVLCPPVLLPRIYSLDLPEGVCSVLLHPELSVNTAESRGGLSKSISMEQWLTQQGLMGGFITACRQNDHELLRLCLRDVVIEPQRRKAVACFDAVQTAALQAGAYGCSLSGSGPSIFALCAESDGEGIASAMLDACVNSGIDGQTWISPMAAAGAYVESGS